MKKKIVAMSLYDTSIIENAMFGLHRDPDLLEIIKNYGGCSSATEFMERLKEAIKICIGEKTSTEAWNVWKKSPAYIFNDPVIKVALALMYNEMGYSFDDNHVRINLKTIQKYYDSGKPDAWESMLGNIPEIEAWNSFFGWLMNIPTDAFKEPTNLKSIVENSISLVAREYTTVKNIEEKLQTLLFVIWARCKNENIDPTRHYGLSIPGSRMENGTLCFNENRIPIFTYAHTLSTKGNFYSNGFDVAPHEETTPTIAKLSTVDIDKILNFLIS